MEPALSRVEWAPLRMTRLSVLDAGNRRVTITSLVTSYFRRAGFTATVVANERDEAFQCVGAQ